MFLEGDIISGDSFRTLISDNNPLTETRYKDLKQRIHNLKNYKNEFIILECEFRNFSLNYIQFLKQRVMGHLDEFIVQINILTDSKANKWHLSVKNCIMYEAVLKEKELIRLVGDIFIDKTMPSFDEWENITTEIFGQTYDKFKKPAESIIADYYNGDLLSNDGKYLFYEANKYIAEGLFSGYDITEVSEIYAKYGLYNKISKLYNCSTSNPRLQKCMGDIEYYGYIGEPDYKKAFEFYSLAFKCGNISAGYMLGKMYKEGLGVEKDITKYEKIIRGIYNLVVKKIGKRFLSCIGDIILELSYIEKEKGNFDKSLKYALQAKKELTDLWKYEVEPTLTESKISEQINNLVGDNRDDYDMSDLFVLLKEPKRVAIIIRGKPYLVSSFYDNGRIAVEFRGKYYRNILQFFQTATIKGKKFYTFYDEVFYMEVVG